MGEEPRLGTITERSTAAASWDVTQLRLIQIRNNDMAAVLPKITSVTYFQLLVKRDGRNIVQTHDLTDCTEGAARQTLQLGLCYRESDAHCT